MALYRCEGVVLRTRDLAEADRLVIMYTPDRGKHRAVARGARRPRSRLAAGIQPFTRAMYLCWKGRNLDGISQVEVVEGFAPLRTSLERLAAATYACELIDAVTQDNDPQPRLYALLVFTLRALAETTSDAVAPAGPDARPAGPGARGMGPDAAREVSDARRRGGAGLGVEGPGSPSPGIPGAEGSGGEPGYGTAALFGDLERLLLSFQWKLLALTGFRPAFDRCTTCGEPVADDAAEVAVSLAEGGVVCSRHAAGAGTVRILPAAVTGAVMGMLRAPLKAALGLRLTPGAAAALTALSRDYLAYHLERYPQSRAFLDVLREQAR